MNFLEIPMLVRARLSHPMRLDAGSYQSWGGAGQQPFVVELDVLPLLVLFEDVGRGARVYEALAIRRPGDILHYLRVRPLQVQDCVAALFDDDGSSFSIGPASGSGYLSLIKFDSQFFWEGDDTRPEASCWLSYRGEDHWRELLSGLFAVVLELQQVLRQAQDYLARREVTKIDAVSHRQDFAAIVPRRCLAHSLIPDQTRLPHELYRAIDDLVGRDDVQSVSCPVADFWLWRRLVTEQVRRGEQGRLLPQIAFTLSGPDEGLAGIPVEDWGGEVHIPFEGACGADLFIQPGWRKTFPEADESGGSLSDVVFYTGECAEIGNVCHYLLTKKDMGNLRCASRKEIGEGWILYESNRTYEPNPLFKESLSDR